VSRGCSRNGRRAKGAQGQMRQRQLYQVSPNSRGAVYNFYRNKFYHPRHYDATKSQKAQEKKLPQ
jgi:hypothetical protein